MLNSPIEIPGLNLWLHGDAIPPGPVPDVGPNPWRDQSGQGHNFSPAGSTSAHLIRQALNNHAVVRFWGGPNDGTATSFACSFTRTLPQTLLIVAKYNDPYSLNGRFFVDGGGSSGANNRMSLNTIVTPYGTTVAVEGTPLLGAIDLFQWHIYSIVYTSAMTHVYIDGLGRGCTAGAIGDTTHMRLGARNDDNCEAAYCDIAEVVSYDGDKRTDLPALHDYLIDKYDL